MLSGIAAVCRRISGRGGHRGSGHFRTQRTHRESNQQPSTTDLTLVERRAVATAQ